MAEHKPAHIAIVVCDNIYTEPGGKTALVGLFNRIGSTTFPFQHPRLAVFVSLTDMAAGTKGKLDVVHGETDEPIIAAEGLFSDEVGRTDVVDMSFVLNNVQFNEPGTYFIRFFANGHLLGLRPFEVHQIPTKER